MAADDAGERTEAPTGRRRTEAREQGRLGLSSDLTASVSLLTALMLLNSFGAGMVDGLLRLTQDLGEPTDLSGASLKTTFMKSYDAGIAMILPFLAFLLVISAAGVMLQSRGAVVWKKLAPRLGEVNPLAGFKRLCSLQAVTRLALGMLKMACVAGVAWYTLAADLGMVLSVGALPSRAILGASAEITYRLTLRLAMMLLVLGIVDWLYQRWSLERSLKMTKHEVKEEMKRMEGDPLVKKRQRQVQLKVALQRIGLDVPKSDVVVSNPTHYAVALKYDEATMAAPRVMAKGKDFLALRIRQVAQQHGIPIVERPPLARALYAAVDVGQEVPASYYRAVAELLAYVYQLTRRAPRAAGA